MKQNKTTYKIIIKPAAHHCPGCGCVTPNRDHCQWCWPRPAEKNGSGGRGSRVEKRADQPGRGSLSSRIRKAGRRHNASVGSSNLSYVTGATMPAWR
jgi:hypothetical protein